MSLQPEVDLSSPDTFLGGFPHRAFAQLRRRQPVSWCEDARGAGFWSVVRYAEVVEVSRDTRAFSSTIDRPATDDAPSPLALINMDPPIHARYRQIVASRFNPKAVLAITHRARLQAETLVRQAVGAGDVDFVTDIAARLPLAVSCDMIGIPAADQDLALGWSTRLVASDDPELNPTSQAAAQPRAEAAAYFAALARQRRHTPRDDLVTTLVHAVVDGRRLTDAEVVTYCILLLIGGNETTRHTMAHGALALAERPEQWRRLNDDRSLLPSAVDEILRFSSAFIQARRTCRSDAHIGGQAVRAGEAIALWYASANRDESVFSVPEQFDVGRAPNPYLTFGGGGPHVCLGAHLAPVLIQVILEALLAQTTRLDVVGPPVRLRSNAIDGIKHLPLRLTPR